MALGIKQEIETALSQSMAGKSAFVVKKIVRAVKLWIVQVYLFPCIISFANGASEIC